jgi:molybdenum cofactor cytidylyltransferase
MICAILLAAGRSRRMGSQKLLLPFAGGTVIAHVVGQVLAAPVDRTVVVVGADAELVAAALAGRAVEFVANPDPEGDMLSSVRCGLRALPADCEAALVALGDQPGITAGLVGRMVEAWLAAPWGQAPAASSHSAIACRGAKSGIYVPACGGRRGHPILFSARYRDEILGGFGGVGLRGLLQSHPQDVREVPVPPELLLEDMDYPEDYRRELGKLEGGMGGPHP